MDPDTTMFVGLLIGIFAFPALVSSILNDGLPSKVVGFLALVSVAVMTIAAVRKPGGYDLLELPGLFFSVLGRLV